jgi:hypothetical protein
MRHYNTVENCLLFDMRHFLKNENKQKKFKATLHHSLQKKIKTDKFEVGNRQCFKSGSRMNQDSMGSVDPDPDPSRSKWSLKIGQKQRNFLSEELSGGVSLS